MKKLQMIATGRVQGVGFRWGVKMLADQIGGIYGTVWNEDDGSVHILAQSEDSQKMARFIQEIRKGPTPMSHVSSLDVTMTAFPDATSFRIGN